MSRYTALASRSPTSFPRVSGDEPLTRQLVQIITEFSPRERG